MQFKPFKLGVTLNIFNIEKYIYKYILEDMLEKVSIHLGNGQGVEITAPIHDRSFLHLSNEIARRFRNTFEKYEVAPSCYSCYSHSNPVRVSYCTDEEQFDYTKLQLDSAKKLGFSIVKAGVRPRLLPQLAKYCEKIGIKLGIEIHSPQMIEDQQETIEIIKLIDSDKVGIIPDFRIFSREQSEHHFKGFTKQGVDNKYKELIPFIVHFHDRFINTDDTDEEETVRFAKIVEMLQEVGYDGFISSEYEGYHWYSDNNALEQIRYHQALIRSHMK